MLAAPANHPATEVSPLSAVSPPGLRLFLAGLVLLVASAALWRLATFNHDEPPLSQLAHDAEQASGALLRHETGVWQSVAHHHDAGERLWKQGLLAVNGQLDHRFFSLATIALQSGAFALLLLALARTLRASATVAIGLMVAGATCLPAFAPLCPPTGSAGMSGSLLLSLLHLTLMLRGRTNSAGWWLGWLIGAASLGWATPGLASAAALLAWSALSRNIALGLANAALVAAGLWLTSMRASASPEPALFTHGAIAWILWAPALMLLWRWLRSRSLEPHRAAIGVLALWGLLYAGALTLTGGAHSGEFLLAALALNVACVVSCWADTPGRPARNFILAGAWLVVIIDALIHAQPAAPDDRVAKILLDQPELRAVLPISLRAPLALGADTLVIKGMFAANRAPELPGRGGLPAWGTGSASTAADTGEFVGPPLRSTFPILQIRVAGTLRPPGTSLVLRTTDGREIAPLDSAFTATDRWKRVNFATPAGPFQVVARDNSPTDWLAITAPIEIGGWTRLAGKLTSLWPLALASGLLLIAGAAHRARRHGTTLAVPPLTIPTEIARVAPWLGVFAYLLFFSHHTDLTAGPNDSGGYLNSAKLIASGALAATPRIPAGIEIDRDPTLYVPITFHAQGNRIVPEYPVGFPLEVAAFAKIFPLERGLWVLMLLQLGLGVIFTQKLARAFGLGASWAWLAAAIVGLSPVYLFQALQPQSDGPALVWVTAAVYWAWTSREKPSRAILAGLATALAVLLRPSNVLCVFPVFACLVGRGSLHRVLYWILAGLPAGLWLLWYQHTMYGSWHTTGYGDTQTMFGLKFFPPTLRSYATWLPELFTPLVCLALAAPFVRAIAPRIRLVLTLWAGVFIAFYSVYWCTWDNWYNMRFVLPAAPAMLMLAFLVAQELLRTLVTRWAAIASWSHRPALGLAAALVLLAFLAKRSADRDVLFTLHNNHEHAFACRWVRDHVPANAVVFAKHATGSLWHYTDLPFIRSDHEKAQKPALHDQLERAGRPIYAMTYHWETANYVWGHGRGSGYPDLPGTWDRVTILWDADVMVWKRRPSPP
jgi:hypothetical protein